MTQEEKQLVLIELCTRLPYELHVCIKEGRVSIDVDTVLRASDIHDWLTIPSCQNITFAPYLRPISSMTEEEWLTLKEWIFVASDTEGKIYFDGFRSISAEDTVKAIDYLISHYFDYRGLIPTGLALEAKEGMYKNE